MRTSLDIPDPIYREMKVQAASEGTTLREIVLEGVEMRLRNQGKAAKRRKRLQFPVLRSNNPGSLKLGKECVYEYIPFP